MPPTHPPEFRQRAVELAWLREMPIAQIVSEVGISDSCLRGWVAQADRDEGRRGDSLSTAERSGLVELRRTGTAPTIARAPGSAFQNRQFTSRRPLQPSRLRRTARLQHDMERHRRSIPPLVVVHSCSP